MRKLIFALALGAILIPSYGFSLGLGEIEVNSSLNQKLEARVDLLSAAPEDAETLIVKLASREEFIRAGLDRPLIVTTLKFKTLVEDGNVFVNVTTPKPIREPFLNFLMEVDWPKGHLLREYTILLDPPVFNGGRAYNAASSRPAMHEAASSAPVAVQSSASADDFRATAPAAVESVAAEAYAPAPVPQTAYAAPSYSAPAGHRVQSGDTAWSIANSMKPDDSVSTAQMLVAMLRANPEVFINENVNGLKRGYILRTPDAADINAISQEEARATVRQQNALWREYQQSMASDQPASSIDDDYTETEYSSAVDMDDDSRLSIVSAGGGSSASGDMKDPSEMTASELREQLALARERVETERVEKETLQRQVGSLTTQVDKMKGLLTIEDDDMAEIQSAGMDDEVIAVDEFGEEVVADGSAVEAGDEEEALDALDALTGETELDETEVAETADDALFVDETSEQAVDAESIAEQEMMDDSEPAYEQPVEASLIDTLLNNRMVLGGLLLVVLVIGAIVYLIKRRREGASEESEAAPFAPEADVASEEDALEDIADMIDDESVDDLVSDEEVEASMADAEAEEEEFDAEATMILPSGTGTIVAPAADLQPEEEEEQDDVMAEADVYLAYGIYQQAEELLQNALNDNPDKDNYRVKLAETYFAGKNAEAFEKLGVEMKERLGDAETPAWNKVVAMGKELCPEAEVFQQAGAVADLDLDNIVPKSPEPMDFDLGEDAGELDLDFNSPLDESSDVGELELPSMGDELGDDLGGMEETAIISPHETAIMDAESSESVDELEFDLSETDAIEEAPVEESADEEEFSLDIEASELDLDAGEVTEESADAAGLDMDFDMSMDSEPETATEEVSEAGLDMDLDLDMSMDTESEITAEAASEEVDLDLDLDMSMGDDAAAEVEEAEFDLSEEMAADESLDDLTSDLDMSVDDAALDMGVEDADLDLSDDLGDMDLSESLDADEISTKLDLAKAYLDMGDHEGARDILEEVLAAGNDEQKKEAEELMAQAG
ncbi:FimV/HubP family polar landmark protein [Pseudomonadota bacterium]